MPNFRSKNNNFFAFKNSSTQSIVKQIDDLIHQHIISQEQQELVQTYSKALHEDFHQQRHIKNKIVNKFIDLDNRSNKKQYFLDLKHCLEDTATINLRNKIANKIRASFSSNRETRRATVMTPIPSSRYQNKNTNQTQSTKSKRTAKSTRVAEPFSLTKQTIFSKQLDGIISESYKTKRKRQSFKGTIVTATQRKLQMESEYKNERKFIVNKVIQNEIEDFLKNYQLTQKIQNPEQIKKQHEIKKYRALSNLQKYSMSFTNYMRQKTYQNIERTVYNDKIRQKDTFLQKFQDFILTELRFSDQARRRLQKIFKNIELQYMHNSKKTNSPNVSD